MAHPTQQLFGTEVHTMQSDAVGDAFEITVAPRRPNLTVSWRIFPEETHFTMSPVLTAQGLLAVYADWRRR